MNEKHRRGGTGTDAKKLISLLLALCLLAALPLPAFAEGGEGAIPVRFESDYPAALALLTMLDAEGQPVSPFQGEDGSTLYGCFQLSPGTYYYYLEDPTGTFADLAPALLTLEEDTLSVDISLNLVPLETEEEEPADKAPEDKADAEDSADEEDAEASEEDAEEQEPDEEAPLMPVILQCRDNVDLTGLTVYTEDGIQQTPYTDPETEELFLDRYLLLPGEYVYLYRDPAERLEDQSGRFTVTGEGMQFVALPIEGAEIGQFFFGTVMNPAYSDILPTSLVPLPSITPEESLAQLQYAVSHTSPVPAGERRSLRTTYYAASDVQIYNSVEAAGEALKRALQQRQEEVRIRFTSETKPTEQSWWQLCGAIYNTAIRHTGAPTEGDYLRYEYGGVNCEGSATGTDRLNVYAYEFIYTPYYFTTPEQEAELNGRVAAVLGSLALAGKSDEQKIRAIYQFLSGNVAYSDPQSTLGFTAYSALFYGKAACQGFAVAFYRLCLEAGVDARVVTSTSMRHAWNIARVDGNRYYALDATWDSGNAPENWEYYLKGRTSWQDSHTLGDEFVYGDFGGYTFPEQDYGSSYAVIHSVSVVFDGMLRIKYYFTIPERLAESDTAYIQFSREGEVFAATALSEGRREDGYLCFYCGVKAEDVDVPVQVRILDGEGGYAEIRSQNGTVYPNGFFFSAMEYARQMKTGGRSATMRALAQALEDYGSAAQLYFKKSGAEELRSEVKAVSAADLAPWSVAAEGEKPAGLLSTSLSVLFEADNSLRLYYSFAEGVDPDSYFFAIDGVPATLRQRSDGARYLSVENIGADHLHEAHRFTISDGTHTSIITASVLGYGKSAIERGGEAMADLGRALYLYNRAARAYFGT